MSRRRVVDPKHVVRVLAKVVAGARQLRERRTDVSVALLRDALALLRPRRHAVPGTIESTPPK